jgi:hypothetical protein
VGLELRDGAFLVDAHEPAVASHIGRQNGREPSLYAFAGQAALRDQSKTVYACRGQDSMGAVTRWGLFCSPGSDTVCDIPNRNYHYTVVGEAQNTVVGEAQSTERTMKILFLATAACLVFLLSSSAQAQKTKFSDQYCVPYCANYCANPRKDGKPHSQECHSKCLTMCHELGH